MFKKEPAVSPVIATILMVSITIVLAATVYIFILSSTSGSMGNNIVGSFTQKTRLNDTAYKLVFSEFNPPTRISAVKLVLVVNSTDNYQVYFNSSATGSVATITPQTPEVSKIKIIYYDQLNNSFINTGDYLIIENLRIGTHYDLYVTDSNGNQIAAVTLTP